MKKILLVLLCSISGVALAQTIDCSQYQQQVNQDMTQMANVNAQLMADENNLNGCQTVNATVSSPVYQQTLQAIQASAPVQSTPTGANWNVNAVGS
jgi:hypothetical protein